jgi:ribose transport system substrate-binding protein
LATLLLTGCGATEGGDSKTSTKSPAKTVEVAYDGPEKEIPNEFPEPAATGKAGCTIGLQIIIAAIPALQEEQAGAEAEAKRLGCKIIALDDRVNPTTQVNNFNQLLSQDVDAISVYPIVPTALGPSVAQANKQGVKVISDSSPASASDPVPEGFSARVLQGFDTVAYLRTKYIAETKPGAEFAIIGLAKPVASLQYLAERTKYWADRFGLKFAGQIDAQDDDPSAGATAMSAILGKYPGVEAVFAFNDNTAVSASTVARSSQSKVLICGNTGDAAAFKAIESDALACTVRGDFRGMGTQVIRAAYDLITGQGGTMPKSVIIKQTLVTKANVGSVEALK